MAAVENNSRPGGLPEQRSRPYFVRWRAKAMMHLLGQWDVGETCVFSAP